MTPVEFLRQRVKPHLAVYGIFAICFAYFLGYIPYSMLTKMATKGLLSGMDGVGFDGFKIQSVVVTASSFCTLSFIVFAGWWRHMTRSRILGFNIPRPQWFTLISGVSTAIQIFTTTLAYTFSGISIVFAMLLMRGGVLVMAPVVDAIARRRRHIYWPSWVAAFLSLAALLIAFAEKTGTEMTPAASINIALYLFGNFLRLFFMSNRAKTDDPIEKRRYFAEEQSTANVILFLSVVALGVVGAFMPPESIPGMLWEGFTKVPFSGYVVPLAAIGFFSSCGGVFGSLIYLDKRENTFTVPANRSSSMIAGVVATYLLAIFYGQRYPSVYELIGTAIVIGAIFFLSYRVSAEKRGTANRRS